MAIALRIIDVEVWSEGDICTDAPNIIAERLQMRSTFKVRQFSVDRRKTLFCLLVLFAIPSSGCFAQTPPPTINEHTLDGAPPTVVTRIATRFSLGSFVGHFEETQLDAVRKTVGKGNIQQHGDAGDSVYRLCYERGPHRLRVVSSGEIGGPDHLVTEIIEELGEENVGASTDCGTIPENFLPVIFDSKLRLGMSRQAVVEALGLPSKSDTGQTLYFHQGKLANGFDETAWLILRFAENKLIYMRGGKTTTN